MDGVVAALEAGATPTPRPRVRALGLGPAPHPGRPPPARCTPADGWPGAALREYDRYDRLPDAAYQSPDCPAWFLAPSADPSPRGAAGSVSGCPRTACTSANCSPAATSPPRIRWPRQMVNFVYLIGDRETGEAVVIDPAYDVDGLLDLLAADDMRLVGALATHYHPDHVGGDAMGYSIQGRGAARAHVGADPSPPGRRGRLGAAGHRRRRTGPRPAPERRRRPGRRDPHRAHPHAGAHRAASASSSTTASSPATPLPSRAAAAPTRPAATRRRSTRASPRSWPRCPTTPPCSRPPLLHGPVGVDGRHHGQQLRAFRPRNQREFLMMLGGLSGRTSTTSPSPGQGARGWPDRAAAGQRHRLRHRRRPRHSRGRPVPGGQPGWDEVIASVGSVPGTAHRLTTLLVTSAVRFMRRSSASAAAQTSRFRNQNEGRRGRCEREARGSGGGEAGHPRPRGRRAARRGPRAPGAGTADEESGDGGVVEAVGVSPQAPGQQPGSRRRGRRSGWRHRRRVGEGDHGQVAALRRRPPRGRSDRRPTPAVLPEGIPVHDRHVGRA